VTGLAELHTPNITVTTAHITSSWSSLAVAWQRLSSVDVPLPLGSRTVPGLSYQLLTSYNCNSKLTQPQLLYSTSTDRAETISSIIACVFVAGVT
jgi:hypothetical protein